MLLTFWWLFRYFLFLDVRILLNYGVMKLIGAALLLSVVSEAILQSIILKVEQIILLRLLYQFSEIVMVRPFVSRRLLSFVVGLAGWLCYSIELVVQIVAPFFSRMILSVMMADVPIKNATCLVLFSRSSSVMAADAF